MKRRKWLSVAAATAFFGAWALVWVLAEPSTGEVRALSADLQTQDGLPFSMDQLLGKTVVLNFIFTHCPTVCPLSTQALRRVHDGLPAHLKERVHFVSVSIDPERDTPDALTAFAERHGLDVAHWTLVTGQQSAIDGLAGAYSAQVLPAGADPLDHRTDVRLIDGTGRLLQTYAGNPLDESRLLREMQTVDRLFRSRPSP